MKRFKIVYAAGDGIGPEITHATLEVLSAAKAPIDLEEILIGEKLFLQGKADGIADGALERILSADAFLKAPITTPQGGGFRSVNVTFRNRLGLFANVRPARSFPPFVDTKHPQMDLVIIRENEEDLYCGIEYQSGPEVATSIKTITRMRSERIIRYAFEYARSHGRKKVTAFTKDNIMKRSDGLFHHIFDEVGKEYPDLEKEHWIVDIGAAKLADSPELFDVIVLENLYGDILSDVAAQIAGSVGLAGSMNIGDKTAMFEAIHGSAPRRAGMDMANPSAMLWAGIYMLDYLGESEKATLIANSWLKTIEDGVHTYDIFKEGISHKKVGTADFAKAVIKRLGDKPSQLKEVHFSHHPIKIKPSEMAAPSTRVLVGVDIYLYDCRAPADQMIARFAKAHSEHLRLEAVTNQGTVHYPHQGYQRSITPEWRGRFMGHGKVSCEEVLHLASQLEGVCSIQMLFTFDGKDGFSAL